MKILFLTSRLPYPPYRGDKLKMFNLIRQLSRRHEIVLLSFIASKDELRYLGPLSEFCREIRVVHLPLWRSALNCAGAVFSPAPFQVAYYRSAAMARELSSLLGAGGFDIVHVHLIRMAQYARDGRAFPPRVLDLTDAGSLYLERFRSRSGNPFLKLLIGLELGRLNRYERVLERFDLSLVCSEIDREVLLGHAPRANIGLLFNGIDLEYFSANGGEGGPQPDRIIFTGNLTYFPNRDGVRYFLDEIFPRIKAEIPGAKLYIVGKDPPPAVTRLVRDDVVVTGFVPDIRKYYLESSVAVAPIRFGAGTLNKVLEPLALGVPVVSSSIGVEGLPLKHGEDLLVADTPAAFAESVIRVLRDPSLGRRLAERSAGTVRRLYDWRVIADRLDAYYRELPHAQ